MKQPTQEAYQLLMEGTLMLARMEHNGMKLDMDYLDRTITDVEKQIKEAEAQLKTDRVWKVWKKCFGDKANLGSSDQLATVIYKELGHPCESLTATGKFKADEEALQKIDEPFIKDYFARKKLEKALTTYLYGFRREQVDGVLHPSFNFNPRSYRSGCSDPNVQNIPNRGKTLPKLLRDCFIPRRGRRIVEIDYGQLEVRIAACYHKDPNMLKYIRDPTTDMHRDTAMDLFMIPKDQVEKKTTRDWAKNRFVFPEFYGQIFFGTAPNLWKAVMSGAKLPNGKSIKDHLAEKGITELGEKDSDWTSGRIATKPGTFMDHVRKVEDIFWKERFPVYTEWKQRWWQQYCQEGGYHMLSGFAINGVFKRNDVLNWAIQGSSFHCLLWSAVEIQKYIDKHKMKTKIINEIHDCLVADVPEPELQDYLYLARKVMVNRCMKRFPWIIVPLEIEAEVTPEGGTWFSKQVWEDTGAEWRLKQ